MYSGKFTATKSTRTPCSSETQSDCSPLSCLFRSSRERMGSPSEGWPEFVAGVFVLHQVFTQNTSAPLRMRSTRPSNLLRRQRHSVPQNSIPPKVTLWPHRGSRCQPCLNKEQRCPPKDIVFKLKLSPGLSSVSRLSGLRLTSQRSGSRRRHVSVLLHRNRTKMNLLMWCYRFIISAQHFY